LHHRIEKSLAAGRTGIVEMASSVCSSTEKEIGAMNKPRERQRGASAVGTVILLAIVAYGVFVGIQYVPQLIESGSVHSVLNSIEGAHHSDPARSVQAVRALVDNHLSLNQMNHLRDSFNVREFANDYVIEVSYERDLDLFFTKKVITYETSLTLR
jgi:hypothetical protein